MNEQQKLFWRNMKIFLLSLFIIVGLTLIIWVVSISDLIKPPIKESSLQLADKRYVDLMQYHGVDFVEEETEGSNIYFFINQKGQKCFIGRGKIINKNKKEE